MKRVHKSRPYDSGYRKALYRKSERARLGFINGNRRRTGLPLITSLDEIKPRMADA
ncbi:MAG: hypothetical protein V4696_07645 [Pseudomonadota bacterium]